MEQMTRRLLLGAGAAAALPASGAAAAPAFSPVVPGRPLVFPRDHGAHPGFRTEWWYITGWLEGSEGPLGFQITFFRTRTGLGEDNPSRFAPRQVLFAHAALSDPKVGRLLHGQRIARQGFGLAEASERDMDIVLDGWRLRREPSGRMQALAGGEGFTLDLALTPTQPVLLQGQAGYSRKGPQPGQASWYYTLPHLEVGGVLERDGRRRPVRGRAWLDREWSSTLLDPAAVGWDWAGINLDDGGALTAFRVRDARGRALWTGGSLRSADGRLWTAPNGAVAFEGGRTWRSPRTGAVYPVAPTVRLMTPAGERRWALTPLFDDQELDSRPSGGPVYWEGAVRIPGGRGYLELTGYAAPLRL
ncbi:lipocalin-like domain-containing protein [Phenylobacterium parvum]|nr:carotenoid 1,2-hydratase [Phenylobacterium parvum]